MDTTEKMLFEFFRPYGAIARYLTLNLVPSQTIFSVALRREESGFPKGTAFIQFDFKNDAIKAILTLNGTNQVVNPEHVCYLKPPPASNRRSKPLSGTN